MGISVMGSDVADFRGILYKHVGSSCYTKSVMLWTGERRTKPVLVIVEALSFACF
jgi:hypothetical protein